MKCLKLGSWKWLCKYSPSWKFTCSVNFQLFWLVQIRFVWRFVFCIRLIHFIILILIVQIYSFKKCDFRRFQRFITQNWKNCFFKINRFIKISEVINQSIRIKINLVAFNIRSVDMSCTVRKHNLHMISIWHCEQSVS